MTTLSESFYTHPVSSYYTHLVASMDQLGIRREILNEGLQKMPNIDYLHLVKEYRSDFPRIQEAIDNIPMHKAIKKIDKKKTAAYNETVFGVNQIKKLEDALKDLINL